MIREEPIWKGNTPGREWLKGFLKRFPALSFRKGEVLSSQRLRGGFGPKQMIWTMSGHNIFFMDP